MAPEVVASFPLVLALVLVVSGVAKLNRPERAAAGFDSLAVPGPLARPWLRAAHPWGEIGLGLGLVLTTGWLAVAVSVTAFLLMGGYLVLVIAAVRRPTPVDCACFGALGPEEVTGWTVARNTLLVAVAGIWLVAHVVDGRSPLERLSGPGAWSVLPVLLAVVVTASVTWSGPASAASGGAPAAPADPAAVDPDGGAYVRTVIPHVPVTLPDGSVVSLRQLARSRPQLLLAVSTTCGSCAETIASSASWADRLPELDLVRLYATEPVTGAADGSALVFDPQGYVVTALGLSGTPSAVLLGADGFLAGGPVGGHREIAAFVDDIEAELSQARQPAG